MSRITKIVFLLIFIITVGCSDKFDINEFNVEDPGNISGDTIYIPLNPAWNGFNNPQDIIIGREPLIYVADTDNDRVVLINLDGQVLGAKNIKRPVALAQDYRLNLYVCAEFDTLGQTFGALYKLNLVQANHQIQNASMIRILPRFEDLNKPERRYTGVAVFYDNTYLVARSGPNNSNLIDPDNSILRYHPKGDNAIDSLVGRVPLLDPNSTGILSVNGVSSLVSFNKRNYDIVYTLAGDNSFRTQWLEYITSQEFTGYSNKLPAEESDIMTPGLFLRPEGVTLDNSGNIYVADAGKDSVYKFNSSGDLLVKFGGPDRFRSPYSVAFFDRVLYVADTFNNRILRFILSTDIN